MSKRAPLDWKQKTELTQYWIKAQPVLRRTDLRVLLRLIYRQNTKTGRCDPSAAGLASELSVTIRSVRSAFKQLEFRGALARNKVSGRSRNQFYLPSVDELNATAQTGSLNMVKNHGTTVNGRSQKSEAEHPMPLKCASPEIEKKRKRKEGPVRARKTEIATGSALSASEGQRKKSEQTFHNTLSRQFGKFGHGYEELLKVDAGFVREIWSQYHRGEIGFSKACQFVEQEYLRMHQSVDQEL